MNSFIIKKLVKNNIIVLKTIPTVIKLTLILRITELQNIFVAFINNSNMNGSFGM